MPKVSIIMPLNKGFHFMEQTFQSILGQSFTDWEFIIVSEFGCNDDSLEYVRYFTSIEPRIQLIQNTTYPGWAESMNVGLESAAGEYIARADMNDLSVPERLEKQVKFLDTHPEITSCGCTKRQTTAEFRKAKQISTDIEKLRAAMIFGNEIDDSSVMFRKQYFDQQRLKYNSEMLAADYDLWAKILFKIKFAVLPEALVVHHRENETVAVESARRLKEESQQISAHVLREFGIDVEKEGIDIQLLSRWDCKPEKDTIFNPVSFLKQGYHLLALILSQNRSLKAVEDRAMRYILWKRWNWLCDCCNIKCGQTGTAMPEVVSGKRNPKISVILPIYKSAKYLRCAIDSVIAQTTGDWELLLINEYGSDDGSREIALFYGLYDSRIHLIQNEKRLGLGESLNLGFRQARGDYLARLDADDIAHCNRFERQANFLDHNPEVGICGSWQHHFGPNTDWVHRPPAEPEQCRANLLFWCDLCHSTLMLRRETVLKYQLFFDPNYLAEDFELWTRAVRVTKIANIPEVLGEYRWGDDNITLSKKAALQEESGRIVAASIRENLHFQIPEKDIFLLNGWENPFQQEEDPDVRQEIQENLKQVLIDIYNANEKYHFYKREALLAALGSKWRWATKFEAWNYLSPVHSLSQVFDEAAPLSFSQKAFLLLQRKYTLRSLFQRQIKSFFKPIWLPLHQTFDGRIWKAESNLYRQIENTGGKITGDIVRITDSRIWQAEKRIIDLETASVEMCHSVNQISRLPGEKIRIVIIFQVASFWFSIENFYRSCRNDARFDLRVICYDDDFDPTIKTDTARDFLEKNGIKYTGYESFELSEFRPHAVVLQTPYDTNRMRKFTSSWLAVHGYRVIYIPYRIEISAAIHAREAHFNTDIVKYCWRLYSLSRTTRKDYLKYCTNSAAVRVTGLPQFDSFYTPERYPMNPEILKRAHGRKIVLWKIRFPKMINNGGKWVQTTPEIREYIKFAGTLEKYNNLFFIFMPQPRFKESNQDCKVQRELAQLMERLLPKENVYIDDSDDYRNSLMHADGIIVDRSAVMVEAAATGVPVLYMYNKEFDEPLAEAIRPLIDSYYHGTTCLDMEHFLTMFQAGRDPLKECRNRRFEECIPFFDGNCGARIRDDIEASIPVEQETTIDNMLENSQILKENTERLCALEEKLNDLIQCTREQIPSLHSELCESHADIKRTMDSRIWKAECNLSHSISEVHNHIDYTYRDIMIVLENQLDFIGKHRIRLLTEYPVASDSLDHQYPHGTAQDNTRYPRFIRACERLLKKERGLSFLDLGCSGGGMVLDAVLRGHLGIGLEGSDFSLVSQRAEWRLLKNNLFTCDIARPFSLIDETSGERQQFDVITAWEVLEHIREENLPVLFENIRLHLKPNGIFVGSVADWDDIDPQTGINWHCCVHPHTWWEAKVTSLGFDCHENWFSPYDMARGGINHPLFYTTPNDLSSVRTNLFLVLTIREGTDG